MLHGIIATRLDALKPSYVRGPTTQNGEDLTQGGRANISPPLLCEEQDGKDETKDGNGDKLPTVGGAAINPQLLLVEEQDGDAEDREASPPVKIDWSLKTVAELKEELHSCSLPVVEKQTLLREFTKTILAKKMNKWKQRSPCRKDSEQLSFCSTESPGCSQDS
jgi:hypothetical protein